MAQREETERLATALSKRFSEEEASGLAELLSLAYCKQMLSYEEIELPSPYKEELLMVAHRQRLLISMSRSSKGGSAWEDKVLTFAARERYQMPRIVRHLIERARESGEWNPKYAAAQSLNDVGESRVEDVVEFLALLITISPERRVTPEMMNRLGVELRMELKLHRVIDEFVRCGMLSSPLQVSLYTGSAHYEVNPCLYWKCP